MARQPYCRDVTVLLCRVFRFAAITVPRTRMLARDASFFSVISTASLWDFRLCRHMYHNKCEWTLVLMLQFLQSKRFT